jgi:ketoreductase RED2
MEDRRVALVTGSTSGIGRQIAVRLAGEGMRVVLNSARSADEGKRLAAELPDAVYVQADLTDDGAPTALVDAAADAYGRIDVLVNNAGRSRRIAHQDLKGAPLGVWREIFELNLFATWAVTSAAVPWLRETGGSILNISSIAGERVAGSSLPYAVSKAAIAHLTRLLAAALGPDIRVNALAPGLIDTPWTRRSLADVVERVETGVPLRRLGTTDDVADAAVLLLRSTYTTGEVLLVDGGAHLL